jgi:hypothetical protein
MPEFNQYEEDGMKRVALVLVIVVSLVAVAMAIAGEKSKLDLKVGDEVYACNCGEKCPCQTMSNNAGKCTCGKDMVKAKVTKVEGGTVQLTAAGWAAARPFATTGKYMCACGPECKCDTISQAPGKCTCGKEMKKVI